MAKSNNFTGIKNILDNILKNEKYMPNLKIVKLKRDWNNIVGKQLSKYTQPKKIYQSVLVVDCNHSGWINTLQFYKDDILNKIREYYPDDMGIKDIKFFYFNK